MTQPGAQSSADAIRGLIEERNRYQSWIEAIEGRRGATPPHVFDRVHSDYTARHRGAQSRLAEYDAPMRSTEAALARRQDDVVRRLADSQDELAELELRTLVGEFAPDDGEQRVQQAATVVRELDADRRSVATELEEVRSLLQQMGTVSLDSTKPNGAEVAAAPAPDASPAESAEPPTEAAPEEHVEVSPTRSTHPSAMPAIAAEPARAPDDTFVGTGARIDALAASLGGATAAAPMQPTAGGQERTLRCQDCGEMNYPTEWYCERCGGELAAL